MLIYEVDKRLIPQFIFFAQIQPFNGITQVKRAISYFQMLFESVFQEIWVKGKSIFSEFPQKFNNSEHKSTKVNKALVTKVDISLQYKPTQRPSV